MPKNFSVILDQTGPYYLTAVDKVRPYIDGLPLDLSGFELIDKEFSSRDSLKYNEIEDYKGKRAKGALLAIYQYVDELQDISFKSNLLGIEILNELLEQFQTLLISSPKDLLSSLDSTMVSLKSTFEKWEQIVSSEHDKTKVMRIYQTAYLTFKILHLFTGTFFLTSLPGVKGLRVKLEEMMGVLKAASDTFLKMTQEAEDQQKEQARLAKEASEKMQEAQRGLFAELEGAVTRAKRIVADKIEEESRLFSPKIPQIDLLINFIETLNENDELGTFWRDFANEYRFKRLLNLFKPSQEEYDAWMATYNFQTGKDLFSYFSGLTINQERLEQEAVAATNSVLDIYIQGKYTALANLYTKKEAYTSGNMFEYLHVADSVLSDIKKDIDELQNKMKLLTSIPSLATQAEFIRFEDSDVIDDNAVLIFNRIMREMSQARDKLLLQSTQLEECLTVVFSLKNLIEEKLAKSYKDELTQKFPRIIDELFVKVFGEKPSADLDADAALQTLSTVYSQMIGGIDETIATYRKNAEKLNQKVAKTQLGGLSLFMSSTAKSPWHWLFYWLSPTYHRCFDKIRQTLSKVEEDKMPSITVFDNVKSMIDTSQETFWRWSPTGRLFNSISRRTSNSLFFRVDMMEVSYEVDVDEETSVSNNMR